MLDFAAADTKIMVAVDVLQVLVYERTVAALDSNSKRECPFFRSM